MADAASGVENGGWGEEIDDLLRGIAGGFLIGIPLVYTMETWTIGETIPMPRAIAFVVIAYLVNLAFVRVTGFRGNVPGSRHPLTEALEATGLAILAAVVLLALLYQVHPDQPLNVTVGRIAVNMLPISLGISVTHLILAPRESRVEEANGDAGGNTDDAGEPTWHALILDIGAAFAGAVFLGMSIAPTDEIPMLATEVPVYSLPIIILFSLALTYAIVFEADFGGRERRRQASSPFQRPITETVLAYVTSLLTCVAMLWLFGQIDGSDDWSVTFRQVILLGLPASIGAAAGRLAV